MVFFNINCNNPNTDNMNIKKATLFSLLLLHIQRAGPILMNNSAKKLQLELSYLFMLYVSIVPWYTGKQTIAQELKSFKTNLF